MVSPLRKLALILLYSMSVGFLNNHIYCLFCISVINDILERDLFTLEELLEEDELLQEVKSRNVKLIDL